MAKLLGSCFLHLLAGVQPTSIAWPPVAQFSYLNSRYNLAMLNLGNLTETSRYCDVYADMIF